MPAFDDQMLRMRKMRQLAYPGLALRSLRVRFQQRALPMTGAEYNREQLWICTGGLLPLLPVDEVTHIRVSTQSGASHAKRRRLRQALANAILTPCSRERSTTSSA